MCWPPSSDHQGLKYPSQDDVYTAKNDQTMNYAVQGE